ncbi:MAG TPA: DUF4279 domain-containing protein [Kofleriaceae bacterium]|nr:DUF4279 domain-containing protein [Kofleriaceae bacterium]
MYDDEYKTCRATYATLRIYGLAPDEVTRSVGLTPTVSIRPGELRHGAPARHHAWLLTSKEAVDSKDLRRHLDWILDQLAGRRTALRDLVDRGARIDIFCYWLSASGHGGPTVSTIQTKKLAELEIELSFDIYALESGAS